jgi:hypothetical protein
MAEEQKRTASPPSVGAARGFIRTLLVSAVSGICALLAGWGLEIDAETQLAIVGLLMLVFFPLFEAWGKYMREKGADWLVAIPLALLLVGCGTTGKLGTGALGLADAERMEGPVIERTVAADGAVSTRCEEGCVYERAEGWGFTEKFMGAVTGIVQTALAVILPGR